MIIYSMVSNPGGMMRVAESALSIHEQLKDITPIKIFIFSKRKLEFNHPDIHWVEWDEYGNPYAKEETLRYSDMIRSLVPEHVDYLIGDYMTMCYFDFVKAPLIYDVHILGKPLYQSMKAHPGIHKLDKMTVAPVTTLVDAQEFLFLKFENRFISKAQKFIVNSLNSKRFLKELYTDEVGERPIDYIPVASELTPLAAKVEKDIDVYYFGRFHPQKGFHFMFERDWKDHPISIRGVEPSVLTPEAKIELKKKSVNILPWAWNSSSLVEELHRSRIVLFPSIYEPWGLALQEALSVGCICLANRNHSGHEEQIEDGINGFLVDMKSPDWFKRIGEILAMPKEKLDKISAEASRRSSLGHKSRTDGFVDYVKKLRL